MNLTVFVLLLLFNSTKSQNTQNLKSDNLISDQNNKIDEFINNYALYYGFTAIDIIVPKISKFKGKILFWIFVLFLILSNLILLSYDLYFIKNFWEHSSHNELTS